MAPKLPHDNCYWVVPGRVIAGNYPGDWTPEGALEKLGKLLDAGVRSFVDLTEEGELEPYDDILVAEAARRGIGNVEHHRFPIRDGSIPRSDELTARALDAIERGSRELPSVYLHCKGGIGRTGTIVGCYFTRLGLTGDEALEKVAELWADVARSSDYPFSPENLTQSNYVRGWIEPSC